MLISAPEALKCHGEDPGQSQDHIPAHGKAGFDFRQVKAESPDQDQPRRAGVSNVSSPLKSLPPVARKTASDGSAMAFFIAVMFGFGQ